MQNAPPRKGGCHLASDIVGSNPTSPTNVPLVQWQNTFFVQKKQPFDSATELQSVRTRC